jgi:hypothetical protein
MSNFMFMSQAEARKYRKKLQEMRRKKLHKASAIGPHKGFHRTITKCFHKLSGDQRVALGISKTKNYVAHCSRMAGYARATCGDGVDAAMVSTRAEHRSGNYNRYGTRAIAGVPDSGGPPAIHDITMAKLLAGLDQYTSEFNEAPPHWAADVVKQIDFSAIMAVYEQLPSGLKAAVPLLVAQVVYHYHRDKHGMNKRHRLFTGPLWTTEQDLRHQLFKLLRGADTGQASVLKETYRDKRTDQYQWIKEINERTKTESKVLAAIQQTHVQLQQRVAALERRSVYAQQLSDGEAALTDADLPQRGLQVEWEHPVTPNHLVASEGRGLCEQMRAPSSAQQEKPQDGVVLSSPPTPLWS